jgi:hypothetical protein
MIDDHELGQGGVGPSVRMGHRTPQVLAAYIFGHAAKIGAPFVILNFVAALLLPLVILLVEDVVPELREVGGRRYSNLIVHSSLQHELNLFSTTIGKSSTKSPAPRS